jgi:hypothetical protein
MLEYQQRSVLLNEAAPSYPTERAPHGASDTWIGSHIAVGFVAGVDERRWLLDRRHQRETFSMAWRR